MHEFNGVSVEKVLPNGHHTAKLLNKSNIFSKKEKKNTIKKKNNHHDICVKCWRVCLMILFLQIKCFYFVYLFLLSDKCVLIMFVCVFYELLIVVKGLMVVVVSHLFQHFSRGHIIFF